MLTHHFIVKGKVQGVFFRAAARKAALSLGLVGWVKNTINGDVEIVASGDEITLQEFAKWCHIGPPQASVREVVVNETSYKPFDDFIILK